MLGRSAGQAPITPPPDSSSRFSLFELRRLHQQLVDNKQVNEENKNLVVEILRVLAEMVVYGDSKSEMLFDFFCEKNMLSLFLEIMWTESGCPPDVHIQILQTLSILIGCVRHETSLYYLLSNNRINEIIIYPHDFDHDESLCAQFASFLKSLSLRLNVQTVQFFFIQETGAFPILSSAIDLLPANEPMVRIASQSTILNVYQVEDARSRDYALQDEVMHSLFVQMIKIMNEQYRNIDSICKSYYRACVQKDVDKIVKLENQLSDSIASTEDWFYYLQDLLELKIEVLQKAFANYLMNEFIYPTLLDKFLQSGGEEGSAADGYRTTFSSEEDSSEVQELLHMSSISQSAVLFYLIQLFRIVPDQLLQQSMLAALLHPLSQGGRRQALIEIHRGGESNKVEIPSEGSLLSEVNPYRSALVGIYESGNQQMTVLAQYLMHLLLINVIEEKSDSEQEESSHVMKVKLLQYLRVVPSEPMFDEPEAFDTAQDESSIIGDNVPIESKDLVIEIAGTIETAEELVEEVQKEMETSTVVVEESPAPGDPVVVEKTNSIEDEQSLGGEERVAELQRRVRQRQTSVNSFDLDPDLMSPLRCQEINQLLNEQLKSPSTVKDCPLSSIESFVDVQLALLCNAKYHCLTTVQVAAHLLYVIGRWLLKVIPFEQRSPSLAGQPNESLSETTDTPNIVDMGTAVQRAENPGSPEFGVAAVRMLEVISVKVREAIREAAEILLSSVEGQHGENVLILMKEEFKRYEGRKWNQCIRQMYRDLLLLLPRSEITALRVDIGFELPISKGELHRKEIQVFLLTRALYQQFFKFSLLPEAARVSPIVELSMCIKDESLLGLEESNLIPESSREGNVYDMRGKRFLDVTIVPGADSAVTSTGNTGGRSSLLSMSASVLGLGGGGGGTEGGNTGSGGFFSMRRDRDKEAPSKSIGNTMFVQDQQLLMIIAQDRPDFRDGFKTLIVAPLLYADAYQNPDERKQFKIIVRSYRSMPHMNKAGHDVNSLLRQQSAETVKVATNTSAKPTSQRLQPFSRKSQTQTVEPVISPEKANFVIPRSICFLREIRPYEFWELNLAMDSEQGCMLAIKHINARQKVIFEEKLNKLKQILRKWVSDEPYVSKEY